MRTNNIQLRQTSETVALMNAAQEATGEKDYAKAVKLGLWALIRWGDFLKHQDGWMYQIIPALMETDNDDRYSIRPSRTLTGLLDDAKKALVGDFAFLLNDTEVVKLGLKALVLFTPQFDKIDPAWRTIP